MISTWLSTVRCRALLAVLTCMACVPAAAVTFNVNSPADVSDANPGDGHCETVAGNGACTLRAALEETNALAGADTINLQPGVTYTLTMSKYPGIASLTIIDSVTISGSNNTIDAANVSSGVLYLTKCIRDVSASNVCTFGTPVATISGVAFVHGNSIEVGGGIQNQATLTLSHCVVSSNQAGDTSRSHGIGGGIFNAGTLTLADGVVNGNQATGNNSIGSIPGGEAGGIYNSGTLTVTNSVVANNNASGPRTVGGGIESFGGTLTIDGSSIRDNHNSGTSGEGGGLIVSGGNAIVRNSTISGNLSFRAGGISALNLTLINSTVSGNFSFENGGGLYAYQNVALYNTTVTDNLANADNSGTAIGGGVFVSGTNSVTLTNSIVQGNLRSIPSSPLPILDGDECAGMLSSTGNNLLSVDVDTSHCTVAGSFGTGAANFGPLNNNGGPTQTHALLTGSAAIDAGNLGGCTDNVGAVLTRDQRGVKRPYGGRCDLGAFEAADIIFRDGFGGD